MSVPVNAPTELVPMSPEALEVANAYLMTQNVVEAAEQLGIAPDICTQILAKREVRAYINQVFFDVGFNNRGRMRSAMDAILRKKFQEMEESDMGSSKDIADLMALSHKMTMEMLAAETKLEEIKSNNIKSQVNVQINEGGTKYNSLIERLIEANK